MTWKLTHDHVNHPCDEAEASASGRCGVDERDDSAGILVEGIANMLDGMGFEGRNGSGAGQWLWCLGDPAQLRLGARGDGIDGVDGLPCVDLVVRMCRQHRVVSARLDTVDLVPDWGGSGPEDRLQSEPIGLGPDEYVAVGSVLSAIRQWLDSCIERA